MNRRSFLGTVLAMASAPALVRASSLMPARAWARDPSSNLYVRLLTDLDVEYASGPYLGHGEPVVFDCIETPGTVYAVATPDGVHRFQHPFVIGSDVCRVILPPLTLTLD